MFVQGIYKPDFGNYVWFPNKAVHGCLWLGVGSLGLCLKLLGFRVSGLPQP